MTMAIKAISGTPTLSIPCTGLSSKHLVEHQCADDERNPGDGGAQPDDLPVARFDREQRRRRPQPGDQVS